MFSYIPNTKKGVEINDILNKFDDMHIEENKGKIYSYEKKVIGCSYRTYLTTSRPIVNAQRTRNPNLILNIKKESRFK